MLVLVNSSYWRKKCTLVRNTVCWWIKYAGEDSKLVKAMCSLMHFTSKESVPMPTIYWWTQYTGEHSVLMNAMCTWLWWTGEHNALVNTVRRCLWTNCILLVNAVCNVHVIAAYRCQVSTIRFWMKCSCECTVLADVTYWWMWCSAERLQFSGKCRVPVMQRAG